MAPGGALKTGEDFGEDFVFRPPTIPLFMRVLQEHKLDHIKHRTFILASIHAGFLSVSSGLRIRVSGVQIPPGAPINSRG